MKVLKKGTKAEWPKRLACSGAGNGGGGCGAELLVELDDLGHTTRCCIGESEEYFASFRCPDCGALTDVGGYPGPARELPKMRGNWNRPWRKPA